MVEIYTWLGLIGRALYGLGLNAWRLINRQALGCMVQELEIAVYVLEVSVRG